MESIVFVVDVRAAKVRFRYGNPSRNQKKSAESLAVQAHGLPHYGKFEAVKTISVASGYTSPDEKEGPEKRMVSVSNQNIPLLPFCSFAQAWESEKSDLKRVI